MDLAISTGVTPLGKSFTLPSGKVTWIWSMRVFLACKQNCRECNYVEYRRVRDGSSLPNPREQSEEHDAGKIGEVCVGCYELSIEMPGRGVNDCVRHWQMGIQTSPCRQNGKL